ncbi:unnamed protein product [Orchesella dallaii]|uniref:C2H2-type domain-containing protein n=1 Tax=Orchesella dallaii TaxID=48710 RepID=A0ABP1SAS2_9HEXA
MITGKKGMDKWTMNRNMFSRCLFCATNLSHCHPPVEDHGGGGVKLIRNDNGVVFVTASHQKHILRFKGDSAIQQQLQTYFILRNILKIPKETVCRLLVDHENYFSSSGADPDLWTEVKVCPPCGELVFQYYQAEKKPRLETTLIQIGNKLKEKMEESKNVEGPTSGSIWGRIRNHVLRAEVGEDEGLPASHQIIIKVEKVDMNFEQEDDEGDWDMTNTYVKTEIEDHETDYHYEGHSVSNPSSNLGRWEPHPAPPFNANPPKTKANRNVSKFGYICADCPYKNINSPGRYEAHIQVHFKGSSAIPCPDCGVFMFPDKLSQHRRNHRIKESAPPYSIKLIKKGVYGQKCRDCPFTYTGRGVIAIERIETHILLHKKGPGEGVPCPECGCYQAPEKLLMHRRTRHALFKSIRKKVALSSSSSSVERADADGAEEEQEFQTFDADAYHNYYDDEDGDFIESESQAEGLNVTETIVKTEVVDLGHFTQTDAFLPEEENEEVEESEPIPIYQPPFYLSFFDEETVPETSYNLEHEYRPSQTPTQTKPRRRRQKPSSNPNYTIFSNRPKTSTGSRKAYQCVHCPYTSTTIKNGIEEHVQLHEPGSRAIPCPDCGIYVLPDRLSRHNDLRHPQIRSKVTRRQMKELTKVGQPSKKQTNPHTNPNYKKIETSGFYKKSAKFKCNHCYYRTVHAANIKAHIELHEEGSTAIPCEKCGWFVLPEYMQLHNEHNHTKGNGDGRGQLPLLQCPQCPFESKVKKRFEEHQALHKEGSGGSQCPECDCFTRQLLFIHQRGPLCFKLRSRKKTMKEAAIIRQNENEQNSS